jgi:hypothetical protein
MTKFKDTEGVGATYMTNASNEMTRPIIWWSRKLYYSLTGTMVTVLDLMKTTSIGTEDILTVTHNADGSYSIASTSV